MLSDASSPSCSKTVSLWPEKMTPHKILHSLGLTDDIGPMIASLLSEDNRWVNAQRIEVSGGKAI